MEPHVVYSANNLLSAIKNNVLSALQKSFYVIYQFSYHCYSQYVGRTSRRLSDRIKLYVSKSICSCSSQKRLLPVHRCKSSAQTKTQSPASDSAIGLHLSRNLTCAQDYDDSQARSQKLAMGGTVWGVWGRSPQCSKTMHFLQK